MTTNRNTLIFIETTLFKKKITKMRKSFAKLAKQNLYVIPSPIAARPQTSWTAMASDGQAYVSKVKES